MSQHLKGSNIKLGDTVTIKLNYTELPATELFGQVTGLRLWNPEQIAVELKGVGEWIVLKDNVEIGLA